MSGETYLGPFTSSARGFIGCDYSAVQPELLALLIEDAREAIRVYAALIADLERGGRTTSAAVN